MGTIKLRVINNDVICSSGTNSEIHAYSLNGELLQAHGTPGSGEAGRFSKPYICDVDTAGSVLIADRDNNRLQVMSEQGEFRVLELQPEVSKPVSAVLFNGHLYVTSGDKKTIRKYSW